MSRRRPWPGGYIHKQSDGRTLFIIERKINGVRFHVSTRTHDRAAAMKQLTRFESDPATYNPAVAVFDGTPLLLDGQMVLEYFQHSVDQGVTRKHARNMSNLLTVWVDELAGKDARKLSLNDDVKPVLDRLKTCRQHRIIALKSFFGWLRKEKGLLKHSEDVTLDLPVPQARAEKHKRRKVVPFASVQAVLPKLTERYRDVLTLLAATGMHTTELERFIRSPDSELASAPAGAGYLAVLVTRHKTGDYTRIPLLHEEHVDAARRLREAREVPRRINGALKTACAEVAVDPFTAGVMRHSVATWAIEDGAAPATVSAFLGHKDPRTTAKFYIDANVPTVAIPLRRLSLKGP